MQPRRDLLTVDLCGLKAPLLARARHQGVSASRLVRDALAPFLLDSSSDGAHGSATASTGTRIRVSLRISQEDAIELRDRARAAGVGLGCYVVEAMRAAGDLPSSNERSARLAALIQSNAEIAALATDVAHLVALLSKGSVRAALEYRQTLSMLEADVRRHLGRTALVLSDHGKAR
jgi:hypothetical protein